jgi:hypothetical protein
LSAISIPDPSKVTTSGRALSPDYLPNQAIPNIGSAMNKSMSRSRVNSAH